MADNEFGSNEIRVHVGNEVELSDEVADALGNLAAALSKEAEEADDVSGFMFEMHGGADLFMMMGGGGMGPKISGEIGDGPLIKVSNRCALEIVVTIPEPKL